MAVNISELMRGASDVTDLPILVSADPRLLMNAETAVQIGYRPSVATMALATWVNEGALELEHGAARLLTGASVRRARQPQAGDSRRRTS